MNPASLFAAIALLSAASVHGAQERTFIDEPQPPTPSSVQEGERWQEQRSTLPPWPQDGDLVEFQLGTNAGPFRYFIDGKNLAVGGDRVVRYTLIVESKSGGRNVSVEGLRCTPRGEYKIYAYGIGGSFKPIPGDEWQPIRDHGASQIQSELHAHLLCVPLKFEPRPKSDMLRALRGPINPKQNTGFLPD